MKCESAQPHLGRQTVPADAAPRARAAPTVTVFLLLLLVRAESSASQSVGTQPEARDSRPESLERFAAGVKEWSLVSGFSRERRGKKESVSQTRLEFGSYFRDRWSFRQQYVGSAHHAGDEASGAAGANVGLRYHVMTWQRGSLFVEAYAGALFGTRGWPEDGTNLNFTYLGNLGGTYALRPELHLVGAGGFQHYSNGFIWGRSRNPGSNQYGGYVGLMFTF
ncbi:MAG: acyloxyacyl hydrolase [Planctomycetota bacterium]